MELFFQKNFLAGIKISFLVIIGNKNPSSFRSNRIIFKKILSKILLFFKKNNLDMETLILFWRELEKKLFKIKFGKYQWGFLRQAVYHQLNQPFVDYQLPVQALEYLAGQIDYGPVNKISVIIPTSDRLASLKQYALDSLRQINFSPNKYEIIIVDNSNSDETYQYLSSVKWPKNYQIFRLTKPGICRAYNLGVKSATGDVITFLDDDCRVDQELLNRIYFSHQAGHYLLREGLIYDEAEKTILNRRDHPEKERNFLDGNISYRREVFDFASFNEDIIYGWGGWGLFSQIFVFWPNFNCFYDQVPIKHYRH